MNTSEAEKIREKTQRCLWYVAYESQVHGIMGRSIQNKLSAVTWLFVKNYLPNPFEDLYTLKTFMTDLKKRDPSAIPMQGSCDTAVVVPYSDVRGPRKMGWFNVQGNSSGGILVYDAQCRMRV